MPIERLASLVFAVGLVTALLLGSPLSLPEPFDKAAHFTVFSLLTASLWRATDGEMPLLAPAAALAFGALDEWRQVYVPGRQSDATDFIADLCGVLAATGLLLMQGKTSCAESSQR